jgi:hypothetical protein
MDVTLEDAFAEACRIIGEQTVRMNLAARLNPAGASEPEPAE